MPAKPYRLITSADRTSLASFVYNDGRKRCRGLAKGTNLVPLLGASGHSLGGILPRFGLAECAARDSDLGPAGTGAFGGTGTPYIRLFDYGGGPLREVWDGGSLGFDPNGFVMPLTATTFAAYDHQPDAYLRHRSARKSRVYLSLR
ncbi:MAG: hypothetical protein IPK52_22410 [Chloroflexi bacterium]|nr:hypothetical protein [Chloroflexota bacterium]